MNEKVPKLHIITAALTCKRCGKRLGADTKSTPCVEVKK